MMISPDATPEEAQAASEAWERHVQKYSLPNTRQVSSSGGKGGNPYAAQQELKNRFEAQNIFPKPTPLINARSVRRPEQLQSYSPGGKGGAMPQQSTGNLTPHQQLLQQRAQSGMSMPQPYQATNPYAAQNQNTAQNQLPQTTFQAQYGMPQPYMGGKGMGYGYQPPMYQPAPYNMGGKGMGYGSQPSYNPYAAPQGGKGMGYGSQPSYNPYATQSPYVNYNQPSYGSIGGKGGSIGGKGMTAGGKGG